MATLDPRRMLDELIKERGETYASMSRLLSRNPAYIQQFIKRGSPAHLDEGDIARLAVHFDVPPEVLGATTFSAAEGQSTVALPVLTCANAEDIAQRIRLFDGQWLRTVSRNPDGLSVVIVEGDAMQPTLRAGAEVLIQRYVPHEQLRDGIYAIRADAGLLVRRIAIEPTRNRISVISDNTLYPMREGVPKRALQIVGRVIWAGQSVN